MEREKLSKHESVEIAAAHIENSGFEQVGLSNLSEARYFRLPGYYGELRVAAHHQQEDWLNRHLNKSITRRFLACNYTPEVYSYYINAVGWPTARGKGDLR